MQYSNFKDTLQNIASQIGNVEQEVDEHKYVSASSLRFGFYSSFPKVYPHFATQDPGLCQKAVRHRHPKPSAGDHATTNTL